jgi:hypothetical protein
MRRLAFLGGAAAVALATFAMAQSRSRQPQGNNQQALHQQQARMQQAMAQQMTKMYQAAMRQQAEFQRRQAAMAAQAWRDQAAWHAKARQSSTVVVRPTTTGPAKKGAVARPVVVSTDVTSRTRQTRKNGITTTRTEVTRVTSTPGRPRQVTRTFETTRVNSHRGTELFKETWTRTGPGIHTRLQKTERFRIHDGKIQETTRLNIHDGKYSIHEKWSRDLVSSPAFAQLPLQVQLRQLEHHLPWSWWWLPGEVQKASFRSKITGPGGTEKLSTQLRDHYDKSGRYLGTYIQTKHTDSGRPVVLPPQARIALLDGEFGPGGYYHHWAWADPYFDYLAPWAYPYWGYRHGWRAIDRLAAMEGLPIPIW